MRAVAYLGWFAVVLLGLAVMSVGFTVCVDPYRMFATPVRSGWTALKPRIYGQGGLAKTYQLQRTRPKTILLGNSRVEIGIDPASAAWPLDLRPIFNAAEAGRGCSDLWACCVMPSPSVRPKRS